VDAFEDLASAAEHCAQDRLDDRVLGLLVCDITHEPDQDISEGLARLQAQAPHLEIVVMGEAGQATTFARILERSERPERLTFLPSGSTAAHVARAVRGLVARSRKALAAASGTDADSARIQSLELQVEELKARLAIAKHAARHDDLTGALNRAGFVAELSTRLERDRQPQIVLIMDLDRFKAVNDTLGHSAGDELVKRIAVAVSGVIPTSGVLARLGGDEFGVVIEAKSDQSVEHLCTQILKVCSQSRVICGHEVQVSASIGVAMQNRSFTQVELMRQADLALYAAKREGRNRYRVFDAALDKVTKYRLSIESGLERALRSGQLRMVYQPIVTAATGEIAGYEALVRWDSPDYGAISPADFIPIAEETGLILDIGEWIARQALKDCRRWGGPYVSINLSVRQFLRHNVAERILKYAADADVPARRIQIELTETAIIDDVERAGYNLKILRAAGVRVALDDFGTGYSSLVYLNQFAIDCIKIDKSFVDNVTRDRQSAVIVASVSKLAASLGMEVVAEGVETEDQRTVLMAAGCGALQGYLYGKPISSREVIEKLQQDHPDRLSA
jgi:diguanylate cyclase (GGDEF)-like protein